MTQEPLPSRASRGPREPQTSEPGKAGDQARTAEDGYGPGRGHLGQGWLSTRTCEKKRGQLVCERLKNAVLSPGCVCGWHGCQGVRGAGVNLFSQSLTSEHGTSVHTPGRPRRTHTGHKLTRRYTRKDRHTAPCRNTPTRARSHTSTHRLPARAPGEPGSAPRARRTRAQTPAPPTPTGARPREGKHAKDTQTQTEARSPRHQHPPCAHTLGARSRSQVPAGVCSEDAPACARSCPHTPGGASGRTVPASAHEQGRLGGRGRVE